MRSDDLTEPIEKIQMLKQEQADGIDPTKRPKNLQRLPWFGGLIGVWIPSNILKKQSLSFFLIAKQRYQRLFTLILKMRFQPWSHAIWFFIFLSISHICFLFVLFSSSSFYYIKALNGGRNIQQVVVNTN